jgi:hypothetical protein
MMMMTMMDYSVQTKEEHPKQNIDAKAEKESYHLPSSLH